MKRYLKGTPYFWKWQFAFQRWCLLVKKSFLQESWWLVVSKCRFVRILSPVPRLNLSRPYVIPQGPGKENPECPAIHPPQGQSAKKITTKVVCRVFFPILLTLLVVSCCRSSELVGAAGAAVARLGDPRVLPRGQFIRPRGAHPGHQPDVRWPLEKRSRH